MKILKQIILTIFLAILTVGCSIIKPELVSNDLLPNIDNIKSISQMTQIGLEWQPKINDNIDGYRIYIKNNDQTKLAAQIKDKFASHYVQENLEPDTEYEFIIKPYSQNFISSGGKAIKVRTSKRIDSIVFARIIKDLPSRIKIIWRPHSDPRVSGYIIQRLEGQNWKEISVVNSRLQAEFIDKDAKPGFNYSYRIFAKTFNGSKSFPSEILNASSKPLPTQVTGLKASNNLFRKISLTWDMSDDSDFSHYKIYKSVNKYLPFLHLADVKNNSYEDIVDSDNTSRLYKISIVDKDGLEGKASLVVKGKTLSRLNAPKIIQADFTGDNILLQWSSVNSAISYTIYRQGGGKNIQINNIQDTSYIDNNIKQNAIYKYSVVATDKNLLNSEKSNIITVIAKVQ